MLPQRTNRSYTAAKYGLSIDVPPSTYDGEVDAQWRRRQSALVTWAAKRHIDNALGQCNWETVASEFDTPLIEYLDHFDTSNSTIKSRSLIETYGGWSKTDMERLRQFTANNYADSSTVDWKIAGTYMNVDALEWQRIGQGTFNGRINEVGYRRICKLRDSGLSWNNIYQHFLQYTSEVALKNRWCWFKAKLKGNSGRMLTAEWTDSEHKQTKDLIYRYVQSATRSELVDIIQRELPARPLSDIRLFSGQYIYKLETCYMRAGQMTRLRELVGKYGEDRDHIGEALGVLPSRAQYNWIMFDGDTAQHLGAAPDPSRQVNTTAAELPASRRRDAILSGSHWIAADDETLLRMVDRPTMSTAATWEQASKTLGRLVIACKLRFCTRNRRHKQVTDGHVSLVTSEVQGQFDSSGAVDWSQVCQATGLEMRECLELSQYNVGKASWQYDPDSFSQSMANRMTRFIKEHYLAPVPVNYRAVSNYMWVDMEDCIRIHDMLQGKFTWTEAEYKRAIALKAQRLTHKEISRYLSPKLTRQSVCSALKRYSSPNSVSEPLSTHELDEISRLVDEYAGKYPVVDIMDIICTQLNLVNRCDHHSTVSSRIGAHPHYLAKLRGIDCNDLANRIATGQTTVKLAAKELDIPLRTLMNKVKNLNSKLYSLRWTEEETRKLVDYVQGCDSKPNFLYFSKLLSTKSSRQCNGKAKYLKWKGVLSQMPNI